MLLLVHWKFDATTDYLETPSGWTSLASSDNGTTTSSNGGGSTRSHVFYKVHSGSESDPSLQWRDNAAQAKAPNPGAACIVIFQKGATENWLTPVATDGEDTDGGTSYSATMVANPGITAGDMCVATTGISDNYVMTVPTFTATGVTFATVTEYPANALSSTTGNDIACDACYRLANSGTASAAPVCTNTLGTGEPGNTAFIRLRVNTVVASSFSANAVIGKTLSSSFTANAIDLKTQTNVFYIGNNDGTGGAVLSPAPKSTTANAIILRSKADSFSADAVILKAQTASFTANAVAQKERAGSSVSDAIIQKTQATSFAANAILTKTITSGLVLDSVLQKSASGSFSANALIQKTYPGSLTSDAVIQKTQVGSATADAVIQRVQSGSLVADAVLLKTQTPGIGDAVVGFHVDALVPGGDIEMWVSPPDLETITPFPVLVFQMPVSTRPQHFEIQLDTANTFSTGNLRIHKSHLDQTGWEYWDGDSWEPIPQGGVPPAASGNEGRYTVQSFLTETTWYRRVRAGEI